MPWKRHPVHYHQFTLYAYHWIWGNHKMSDMSVCPYAYYIYIIIFRHISIVLAVMNSDSIWTSALCLSPMHTEEGNLFSVFSAGSNIIIRPQSSLRPSRCGRQRDVLLTQDSRWITETSALRCSGGDERNGLCVACMSICMTVSNVGSSRLPNKSTFGGVAASTQRSPY